MSVDEVKSQFALDLCTNVDGLVGGCNRVQVTTVEADGADTKLTVHLLPAGDGRLVSSTDAVVSQIQAQLADPSSPIYTGAVSKNLKSGQSAVTVSRSQLEQCADGGWYPTGNCPSGPDNTLKIALITVGAVLGAIVVMAVAVLLVKRRRIVTVNRKISESNERKKSVHALPLTALPEVYANLTENSTSTMDNSIPTTAENSTLGMVPVSNTVEDTQMFARV